MKDTTCSDPRLHLTAICGVFKRHPKELEDRKIGYNAPSFEALTNRWCCSIRQTVYLLRTESRPFWHVLHATTVFSSAHTCYAPSRSSSSINWELVAESTTWASAVGRGQLRSGASTYVCLLRDKLAQARINMALVVATRPSQQCSGSIDFLDSTLTVDKFTRLCSTYIVPSRLRPPMMDYDCRNAFNLKTPRCGQLCRDVDNCVRASCGHSADMAG